MCLGDARPGSIRSPRCAPTDLESLEVGNQRISNRPGFSRRYSPDSELFSGDSIESWPGLRLAHAQLTDPDVRAQLARAAVYYAERNAAFAAALAERGIPTMSSDGLSLWVRLQVPARVAARVASKRPVSVREA